MIPRAHVTAILFLTFAGLAFGAVMYPRLPDPSPVHWNFRGEVDGWGPRWQAAFLIPVVSLPVTALLVGLPLLGPFRANFERFRNTYGRICVTIVTGLLALHVVFVLKASGHPLELGATLAAVIGIMIALMGNWLGKVRRNLYVGIRTPWTIANDVVWEKTHRLGGRIMVAVGLATAAVGLLGAPDWLCLATLMGGLGLMVVWAFAYSLYWYRRLGQIDDFSSP